MPPRHFDCSLKTVGDSVERRYFECRIGKLLPMILKLGIEAGSDDDGRGSITCSRGDANLTARVTISDPGWYAAAKLPDTAAQNQIPNDSILTVVQSSS